MEATTPPCDHNNNVHHDNVHNNNVHHNNVHNNNVHHNNLRVDERELRVTRSHVIGQPPRAIDKERRPLARAVLTVGVVAALL